MKKTTVLSAILLISLTFLSCRPFAVMASQETPDSYYTNDDKSPVYTNVKHFTISDIDENDLRTFVRIAGIPSSDEFADQTIKVYKESVNVDLTTPYDIYYVNLKNDYNPPRFKLITTFSDEGVLDITVTKAE